MHALEPHVEIDEHREPDGSLVLSVRGALDLRSAPEFAERMADSTSPRWELVLDLDGLDFMDASGLRVLLAATQRARDAGCSVSLAPPRGAMLRLFEQAGLETVLPLRAEDSRGGRGRFARIVARD